jgi:AcrR family transcriptional regulator
VAKVDSAPQLVSTMTHGQLARRRKLTDAVIELVSEIGPENVQMREVAERSGVALGTAYRYFSSKDHLLAAAITQWQRRLTDAVLAELNRHGGRGQVRPGSPCDRVLAYVQRELRAFQRRPNFARLICQMNASADPFASEALAELDIANKAVMKVLLDGVPADVSRPASVAINSTLVLGLNAWTTGRATFADVVRNTEDVTRLALAAYTAGPGSRTEPAARVPTPTDPASPASTGPADPADPGAGPTSSGPSVSA